jgi:hypothetical protein
VRDAVAKAALFVVGTLLVGVVVSVALWASVYNRWLWHTPPDQGALERCSAEGHEYRWNLPGQRYISHDNWTFPGFHGS